MNEGQEFLMLMDTVKEKTTIIIVDHHHTHLMSVELDYIEIGTHQDEKI